MSLDLPRLAVAEYHRPYVAAWLEKPDQSLVGNLAVWYDLKKFNNEGAKWLKDLRSWWRKSGRELSLPVDGVSSATRPPGEYRFTFSDTRAPLQGLPPGEYQLVVEAVREVGGREQLRLPLRWPAAAGAPARMQVQGQHEFGTVSAEVKP